MSRREAVSSIDSPGAPGSRGLILGDIRGSRAGETCTELVDRFLLGPRGAIKGVFRDAVPKEPGRSRGLCVADVVPGLLDIGEGSDWEGVVFDELSPVCGSSCFVTRVSIGGIEFLETDSGSSRASILSIETCSFKPDWDIFDRDAGSLMREAGVAGCGWSMPPSMAEEPKIGPADEA